MCYGCTVNFNAVICGVDARALSSFFTMLISNERSDFVGGRKGYYRRFRDILCMNLASVVWCECVRVRCVSCPVVHSRREVSIRYKGPIDTFTWSFFSSVRR